MTSETCASNKIPFFSKSSGQQSGAPGAESEALWSQNEYHHRGKVLRTHPLGRSNGKLLDARFGPWFKSMYIEESPTAGVKEAVLKTDIASHRLSQVWRTHFVGIFSHGDRQSHQSIIWCLRAKILDQL